MASSLSENHKSKYSHPEYDDRTIEALMRYFRFNEYGELKWFLDSMKRGK